VRQVNFSLILTFVFEFQQTKETVKRSVYHFQSLLANVGIQQLIIFVGFALMVIGFVFQMFTFGKEILSNGVQSNVIKVLGESAQHSQSLKFFGRQVADLILLGCVHLTSPILL